MSDQYIDVWKDIEGMPDYCDEQLYLDSDFDDCDSNSIVMGFRMKKGHEPCISIRVKKGSREQQYAHWFLRNLRDQFNKELGHEI